MDKKLQKSLYKYFIQTVLISTVAFLFLVIIDKIRLVLNLDIKILWITPIIVSFLAWFLIIGHLLLRVSVILSALVLSYYLFILFMIHVHTYAYNTCVKAIEQKYGELSKELSSNGFYKYHLQARECEYKLVPLPWISKPEISDDPPGFK